MVMAWQLFKCHPYHQAGARVFNYHCIPITEKQGKWTWFFYGTVKCCDIEIGHQALYLSSNDSIVALEGDNVQQGLSRRYPSMYYEKYRHLLEKELQSTWGVVHDKLLQKGSPRSVSGGSPHTHTPARFAIPAARGKTSLNAGEW